MASRRAAYCDLLIFTQGGKDADNGLPAQEIHSFCRRCMEYTNTTVASRNGRYVGPRSEAVGYGINQLMDAMCTPPETAPDFLEKMHD